MRQIGTIQEEDSARKLIAFLLTEKIKAVAEKEDTGWEIWIKNEDDVVEAKRHLQEFADNPTDAKYSHAIETANRLAKEELERHEKSRQNTIVMRTNWSSGSRQKKPLVVTMMIITVAVFMTTQGWAYRGMLGGAVSSPEPNVVLRALLFVDPLEARAEVDRYVASKMDVAKEEGGIDQQQASLKAKLYREAVDSNEIKLMNIMQGQFWRLFTPMFIHFGVLHILFNMMWLNSLGGQFEDKLGTVRFGVFVLTAAVVAQVIQQIMPTNMQGTSAVSIAGGMSGVNFALGGFLWIKSVYEPESGFFLSPIAMFTLILVLFVGIFDGGRTASMANWAHGAGFVFGLLCGYLPIVRIGNGRRK